MQMVETLVKAASVKRGNAPHALHRAGCMLHTSAAPSRLILAPSSSSTLGWETSLPPAAGGRDSWDVASEQLPSTLFEPFRCGSWISPPLRLFDRQPAKEPWAEPVRAVTK